MSAAHPTIHLLRGPHGIPLAAHARVGAPAVRVRFERTPSGIALTVLDPDVVVSAKKVG